MQEDKDNPFLTNLKKLAARRAGRMAGLASTGVSISQEKLVSAQGFARDPKLVDDVVAGAAETHWSNSDSPTGGLPPEEAEEEAGQ